MRGKGEKRMNKDNICKTPEELAKAMKSNADEIIIEGDLKNKVIRIKATGKVAWGVCAASLAVAITLYITTPATTVVATPVAGGAQAVTATFVSTGAAAVLGSAVLPAIAIGVSSGGIGGLVKLRDKYKITAKNDKYIKLKRK